MIIKRPFAFELRTRFGPIKAQQSQVKRKMILSERRVHTNCRQPWKMLVWDLFYGGMESKNDY